MTSPAAARLRDADRHCAQLVSHYENFTVASRLAPRRLRRDLTRVYAYARTTDDVGDETGVGGAHESAVGRVADEGMQWLPEAGDCSRHSAERYE